MHALCPARGGPTKGGFPGSETKLPVARARQATRSFVSDPYLSFRFRARGCAAS